MWLGIFFGYGLGRALWIPQQSLPVLIAGLGAAVGIVITVVASWKYR